MSCSVPSGAEMRALTKTSSRAGRWAFRSALANSSTLLAKSSRRTSRPVSRNSKASARLDLPLLFGPQTTAVSAGRLRVCGAGP